MESWAIDIHKIAVDEGVKILYSYEKDIHTYIVVHEDVRRSHSFSTMEIETAVPGIVKYVIIKMIRELKK